MTPEGRRRKARQVQQRVLKARDVLAAAVLEFRALCSEIGISPPALANLVLALDSTRAAEVQLEQLLSGLKRAARTSSCSE